MHLRIRREREKKGYTREQFAELLEVSVSYLAELERGKTGISVKLLKRVCTVLGVSADYILFGNPPDGNKRLEQINKVKPKYLPLLDKLIAELLKLSSIQQDDNEVVKQ